MHTYKTNSAAFLFNGDLSGDIHIVVPIENSRQLERSTEVTIAAEDILKFVAYNYVLDNAIGSLESMDYIELLNILRDKRNSNS